MDLRNRLEKIENLKRKVQEINQQYQRKEKSPLSYTSQSASVPIAKILEGNLAETSSGSCFYREKVFPLETASGGYSLSEVAQYFPGGLEFWLPGIQEDINQIGLDQVLFFDTETTGLAGGAGTYIFLLGIGYFENNTFCVRQYFMSDYHEEEALLQAVNQVFDRNFKLLVTYNGKCYDFPLMQTRFIMARLPLQLKNTYHLDLLYPVRRLWKRRLQDCSLSNIEKNILNISRGEDIPGYLIPHVYFRYLQNKDARPLRPVFEHNLQDIVSLVFLTAKISHTLRDPLEMGKNGMDLYSIGRIYEGNKDYQYSSQCYEKALDLNLSDEESLEVLRLCSSAYKKQDQWRKAEEAWQDMISLSQDFILYPYEELAKYYEHHLKDFQKAKGLIQEALLRLESDRSHDLDDKHKMNDLLMHRLRRIEKKLNKRTEES